MILLVSPAPSSEAEEEAKGDTGDLGQGVIWLPRVTFPPSDPTGQSGLLPLPDRDIQFKHLKNTIYISRKRGLEVTREGSEFYLRVGGRLFLDYARYSEDKNDLGSGGLGLRTLLIEGDGRFSEKWHFRLSLGGLTDGGRFESGGAFLEDAYATYLGANTAWRFGQHKEPFSLEQTTSNLAMTFMERALPNALVPGRDVGASFHTHGERWSLSAGLFGEDLKSDKDAADQGLGLTGRFVFRPESPGQSSYHVGASLSYRVVTGSDPIFYRSRPESGLTKVRYVNTGEILEGKSVTRIGLEGALVKGPLSVQGEYVTAFVDRDTGFDNLHFSGWYAYVSWFLTGESRRYFPQEGIFGYPKIQSKWGAVELAARYSTLDLNDGSVRGGKERNVTLGINWYLSPKVRIMGNAIFVFCDEDADDNGSVLGEDRPRIFEARLQVRF